MMLHILGRGGGTMWRILALLRSWGRAGGGGILTLTLHVPSSLEMT